jgi:hypothetical protein
MNRLSSAKPLSQWPVVNVLIYQIIWLAYVWGAGLGKSWLGVVPALAALSLGWAVLMLMLIKLAVRFDGISADGPDPSAAYV